MTTFKDSKPLKILAIVFATTLYLSGISYVFEVVLNKFPFFSPYNKFPTLSPFLFAIGFIGFIVVLSIHELGVATKKETGA